jgi:hypothetical protein
MHSPIQSSRRYFALLILSIIYQFEMRRCEFCKHYHSINKIMKCHVLMGKCGAAGCNRAAIRIARGNYSAGRPKDVKLLIQCVATTTATTNRYPR